jgi:hypothetical protein
LLDRQRNDGTWFEPEFTGTGFPLVFYLKYHYYSVYFPLMALSLYAAKTKAANVEVCEEETILRMKDVRIFSPETSFYNNARPDDPPIEPRPPELPEPKNSIDKRPPQSTGKPVLRVFFG